VDERMRDDAHTDEDYETLVKLCQQVGPIDCAGYKVCDLRDVDPAVEHCELIARSLRLSDTLTMAGASGPATLAGAMARANAENLAGIALT
jgi:trimethylamine:corrinoid methyltransferase-like protein